jgi:hypothetical protein|nr:MAG TPA: hypothetical protein [Caudoviricetes sp.]
MDTKAIQMIQSRIQDKKKLLEAYNRQINQNMDTINTRVFESNMIGCLIKSAELKAQIDEDEFILDVLYDKA